MSGVKELSLSDFEGFLSSIKILIADSSGSARGGLAKLIQSLGARAGNLLLTDHYSEAVQLIREYEPGLLIVDYGLGGGRGIQLSEEVKNYKKTAEKIFVLLTANSSESAVAEALEEDVDVFILKPYSAKTLTDLLKKSVFNKIAPSPYLKLIWKGKDLLKKGDLNTALGCFIEASSLIERPALAYFYRAQVEIGLKQVGAAEASYVAGLRFNPLHYKCFSGLFDLYLSEKKNDEAYSLIKKVSQHYPVNLSRLGQVLALAVSTGNFDDIESYYESFKEMESRSDDLVRSVCASLVVCGRHYFRAGQKDRAIDLLKKASVSAAGRASVLKEVVAVFVEQGLALEAEEVLKRFLDQDRTGDAYRVACFLVKNLVQSDKSVLIPELRQMVRESIREAIIWYWLIFHLGQMGKIDEAESVCDDAIQLWPDRADYFEGALG